MKIGIQQSLTSAEAQQRLKIYGPNVLPQNKPKNFIFYIKELVQEPMLFLLIVSSIIYLLLGDHLESLVLGASVVFVVAIFLYQRIRSEHALEALKQLSSPRALVVRDDRQLRISATELVPGDMVVLNEGDRIPADGLIFETENLVCDESLLTGESLPVHKNCKDQVHSSTLVVAGRGKFKVEFTGARTNVGKLGAALAASHSTEFRLRTEIRSLTKVFAWLGAAASISIAMLYFFKYHLWLNALLVGLAAQLSLLPEEFPVVLAVFLALGAWKLSKVKVLVREPEAIEQLGAISVLCVDKTGTLTRNQMVIDSVHDGLKGASSDLIVHFGAMATHPDPFDPTDKAFISAAQKLKLPYDKDLEFVCEYPLTRDLFAMSCVWKSKFKNKDYIVACKGAPEAIIELCKLNEEHKKSILSAVQTLAGRGQRVIAVANSGFSGSELPARQSDFNFEWIGLAGLIDPVREEVPKALRQCYRAGIRVIMITGDYPETAKNIAISAGFNQSSVVVTGTQVHAMDEHDFSKQVQSCNVFARMRPEHKLRIVESLKSQGHTVGMTGDGVNDAPSLKSAHVGIAMGLRGTDVAREAADIVLLDDNFASIVAGIHRGRLIFANIRKALAYVISIHIPITLLSIVPVAVGWPLLLLPVHIVLLELIIDPASTLLFENQPAGEEIMLNPPRSLKSKLFSKYDFLRSVAQGLLISIFCLLAYWWCLRTGAGESVARTIAFGSLIFSNFGLIIADLTKGHPREIVKLFSSPLNATLLLLFLTMVVLLFNNPYTGSLLKVEGFSAGSLIYTFGIAMIASTCVGVWNWLRA